MSETFTSEPALLSTSRIRKEEHLKPVRPHERRNSRLEMAKTSGEPEAPKDMKNQITSNTQTFN